MDGFCLEQPKRFVRVRGDQHRVALPLQQSPGQLAKPVLILHHEHRLRPGARPSDRRRRVHDRLPRHRPLGNTP